MGLKIGQNINFRLFLVFSSVFGRNTVSWSQHSSFWSRPSLLVVTQFFGRDNLLSHDNFQTATYFYSPTCRGYNFFVLTQSWACEYSLESSLNLECNHEGI